MSSKIDRKTHCVLCLSGFAAILAILGIVADYFTLLRMGRLAGAGSIYTGASVGVIVSLLIPICGWCGAQNKNGKQLCFFGFCNYLMGCCDCLYFCFLCTLIIVVTAIQTELSACHLEGDVAVEGVVSNNTWVVSNNTCTGKDRSAIQDFCRTARQTLVNASVANPQDADLDKASDLFVDTKCLETLHKIAVGVMAFLVLGLVLRCCSLGLHCVSGFCGFGLKDLVDKENGKGCRQSDSESDVSGSESD